MEVQMRLFQSKAFARFARSNDITDVDLWEAVERAEKGLIDADLGGKALNRGLPGMERVNLAGFG
jgi:hypothetical protein